MSVKRTKADAFMLRMPDGMRERLKAEADKHERSMNSEIVARLQLTLDADQIEPRDETGLYAHAIQIAENAAKEMRHHTQVLKWMSEQQSALISLLEHVANSDGHLRPEFLEAIKAMVANRGKDTGFPSHPDEHEGD